MIKLVKGDITLIPVDAIVNAANSRLAGGGGVDGAIHRVGGPAIMRACDEIQESRGGCPTGEAVITTAGDLSAKYVIHTVGPTWQGGEKRERELLANAYRNSLELARENQISTISFPNISTGIYGFPKEEAAKIAIQVADEFQKNNSYPETIIFVCFDDANFLLYENKIG